MVSHFAVARFKVRVNFVWENRNHADDVRRSPSLRPSPGLGGRVRRNSSRIESTDLEEVSSKEYGDRQDACPTVHGERRRLVADI
jgi:hypothetical protein